MLTSLKQAFRALYLNPVRTALTTLGVIIGIATVILVLSAGEGFRSLVNSQVEAFGSNSIFVETRVPPTTRSRGDAAEADFSRAAVAVAISSLKNRDVEDIKRLPNINNAYGAVIGQKVASYREVAKNALIFGASASRFDIDKGTLQAGRFYTAAEDLGAAQVAILGSNLAEDLFGQEDPVGKTLRVGELNFEVIGVYDPRGAIGGTNDDENVFVPLSTAQKKLLGIDYLLFVVAEARDPDLAEATTEDMRAVLRRNHNITDPAKEDFVITTSAQALQTFDTIFRGITFLLIAIAAISLVVGGVGIMNIMYVVVTERTSEIGLKKALGAKYSDILNEFLIEAVLITSIGGLIGLGIGSLLGWVVSIIAGFANLTWEFAVPFYAVVLAFGVSASIGIVFGVLPARSAGKLDPIEALRHE